MHSTKLVLTGLVKFQNDLRFFRLPPTSLRTLQTNPLFMQKMKEQLAGGIKPELSDKYKNSYVNYVQLFESNFDKQKPAQVRICQLKQAWSRPGLEKRLKSRGKILRPKIFGIISVVQSMQPCTETFSLLIKPFLTIGLVIGRSSRYQIISIPDIDVTSFSSISYCRNCEYCP